MAVAVIKKTTLRYGLAIAFAFIIASMNPAYAEDYSVLQGYTHAFNNSVTVYSTVFALNKDVSLDTSTYFKYNIDMINPGSSGDGGGDSVKATSGASSASTAGGSSAKDTRHALTAGFSHNFSNIIGLDAYYDYSKERDYTSNTPTISLKKDLFDKNTTLTAGYSRNTDKISGQFLDQRGERKTDNYFVGVTQVISPETVAQLGYSKNISYGLESEGIRLVPIDGALASSCTAKSATCVNEKFPGSRQRKAYIFNINHWLAHEGFGDLFKRGSFKLGLRYYEDDWGITSHTSEFEYNKYLSDDTVLRLGYRYYTQSKAYFIKDTYVSSDYFKVSSPQLEEFDTHLTGIKLIRRLGNDTSPEGSRLFSDVFASSIEGKYEFYNESTGVVAHIVMAGLRFTF